MKRMTPAPAPLRSLAPEHRRELARDSRETWPSSTLAGTGAGHSLSDVSIHPSSDRQSARSCPLAAPGPRACPFGGACHTCPTQVQRKLVVSQPGDPYEEEADRVAEQVTRMPEPPLRTDCVSPQPRGLAIQAKCADCEEDQELLQRKGSSGQGMASYDSFRDVPPVVHDALASSGRPLEPAIRASMESRFSYDFGRVRVHTDVRAVESARALDALAYTVGGDIAFGAGQYAPEDSTGQRLLAHELAHVVQQEGSTSNAPVIQFQRFRDCTPGITGAALNQDEIDSLVLGARMAGEFVAMFAESATRHVRDGTGSAAEQAAFANHFGAPTAAQTTTIVSRFGSISRRLSDDGLLICNTVGSAYCRRGWCGYTDCPGSGHLTHLCPPFFQAPLPCAEPETDRMLLHEAAHAAGACNDIYAGAGYPPANSQNNAPSYAGFAYEVF